jgi:hypothetical protein
MAMAVSMPRDSLVFVFMVVLLRFQPRPSWGSNFVTSIILANGRGATNSSTDSKLPRSPETGVEYRNCQMEGGRYAPSVCASLF